MLASVLHRFVIVDRIPDWKALYLNSAHCSNLLLPRADRATNRTHSTEAVASALRAAKAAKRSETCSVMEARAIYNDPTFWSARVLPPIDALVERWRKPRTHWCGWRSHSSVLACDWTRYAGDRSISTKHPSLFGLCHSSLASESLRAAVSPRVMRTCYCAIQLGLLGVNRTFGDLQFGAF